MFTEVDGVTAGAARTPFDLSREGGSGKVIELVDSGHILGAAGVLVRAEEEDFTRRGNLRTTLMRGRNFRKRASMFSS